VGQHHQLLAVQYQLLAQVAQVVEVMLLVVLDLAADQVLVAHNHQVLPQVALVLLVKVRLVEQALITGRVVAAAVRALLDLVGQVVTQVQVVRD
jgi:hypothetical protein